MSSAHQASAVFECALPPFEDPDQAQHTHREALSSFTAFSMAAWPEIRRGWWTCLPTLLRARYGAGSLVEASRLTPERFEEILNRFLTTLPEKPIDPSKVIDPDKMRGAICVMFSMIDKWHGRERISQFVDETLAARVRSSEHPVSELGKHVGISANEMDIMYQMFAHHVNKYLTNGRNNVDTFGSRHEACHGNLGELKAPYSGACIIAIAAEGTMDILAEMLCERMPPAKRRLAWDIFQENHERLETYVKLFEPIEEVYANFYALITLSPDAIPEIKPRVMERMKAKGLIQQYESFSRLFFQALSDKGDEIRKLVFRLDPLSRTTLANYLWWQTGGDTGTVDPPSTYRYGPEYADTAWVEQILTERLDAKLVSDYDPSRIIVELYSNAIIHKHLKEQIKDPKALCSVAIDAVRIVNLLPPEDSNYTIALNGFGTWVDIRYSPTNHRFDREPSREAQNLLAFYVIRESMRQQIRKGTGLTCPFYKPGGNCCGMAEHLECLWHNLPASARAGMTRPACIG